MGTIFDVQSDCRIGNRDFPRGERWRPWDGCRISEKERPHAEAAGSTEGFPLLTPLTLREAFFSGSGWIGCRCPGRRARRGWVGAASYQIRKNSVTLREAPRRITRAPLPPVRRPQ